MHKKQGKLDDSTDSNLQIFMDNKCRSINGILSHRLGFVSNGEIGKYAFHLSIFFFLHSNVFLLIYFLLACFVSQVRFVVSDLAAHILNTWSPTQQNLSHVSLEEKKKKISISVNNKNHIKIISFYCRL